MNESENVFLYKRRYLSLKELMDYNNERLKLKLLLLFYKNRFLTKHLHLFDRFSLKKNKFFESYSLVRELSDDLSQSYKEITLSQLNYFEALEIDDFDKCRKTIISKFSKARLFTSSRNQKELKEKLAEVKRKFDSISWGTLFYIDFEKKRDKNNDLISSVDVDYIKTNESYFIIKIKISPSEKFEKKFKQIIENKDYSLSKHHYHSYLEILKLKRFYSYESMGISSKTLNIDNLLSDLNQQVKKNITKYFKGYFYDSKISPSLPSIEYYEVGDISKFHLDNSLKRNFNSSFNGYYSNEDNQIEVYFSNSKNRSTRFQVVKQKGHGSKEQKGKDDTDYDRIETHYLLNSLSFPCVFKGILIELFEKLNNLKRDVYDFGNDTKNMNIFKSLFFFKYNNSYLKLKQTLVHILIMTKRFENEFTKNSLVIYTEEFELEKINSLNNRTRKEKTNFLFDTVEEFSESIKVLNEKTKEINEVFKSIEELNSYRTSYLLQIISLFIGILAFIFAFDKVKDYCLDLFNFLVN
ncbi:hypothetical protein [Flavobacterium sp. CAN_S2]|uniref:hypothetical protein n=1 Tax=Flavobacterium sp. CAN_S2 TaxID=2787726 RepID=UPI0018CB3550